MVGLGNPGEAYAATRHNVGFRVIERLVQDLATAAPWTEVAALAEAWVVEVAGRRSVLARPRSYMNRSGDAVAALLARCDVPASRLVVVHDDADLALGRLRLRAAGGSGGHNGVASIVERLGTSDFARVRLGVRGAGRPAGELADYVLRPFEPAEAKVADALVGAAADAVRAILDHGLAAAMNRHNGVCADGGADARLAPPGEGW